MSSTWQFRRKKNSPVWRRVIVFLTGGVILSIGLVMLVLPGPAIVFIPLGLAILATEFRWARKWLATARQWLRGRFHKIKLKKATGISGPRTKDIPEQSARSQDVDLALIAIWEAELVL